MLEVRRRELKCVFRALARLYEHEEGAEDLNVGDRACEAPDCAGSATLYLWYLRQ
jgi:hypothetical protein